MGARLRGRTATQRSKKGSENGLGRVSGGGFSEGEKGAFYVFNSEERVLRRVLRRGSEKFLERPLGEYPLLGVRPKFDLNKIQWNN